MAETTPTANAVINTLLYWDDGVAAYERNDTSTALQTFWKISDPSAKIFFNIGLMQQALGNLQAAEKAFEATITKDQHLAIGHYQLAIIYYKQEKYVLAESSFTQSHACLRSKPYIDYKQLGLRTVLYECEVFHNLGVTCHALREKHKALELLDRAVAAAENCKPVKPRIEESRKSIQMGKSADLLELPKEAIFRPPKSKTANIGRQDYLGKAKVVSSVTEKDNATGFIPVVKENPLLQRPHSPRNFQANTLPSRPPPLASKTLPGSPKAIRKPNRPLSSSGLPIPPPPARPPPIPPPPSRPPPLPPGGAPASSVPPGVHVSSAGDSPGSSPDPVRRTKPPPPSSALGPAFHSVSQNVKPSLSPKPKRAVPSVPPAASSKPLHTNDIQGRADIPPAPNKPLPPPPPPPPSMYDPAGKASQKTIKWQPTRNMAATPGLLPAYNAGPITDVIVKVHLKYTCAIKIKAGTSYKVLNETICKKFERSPTQLNMWYKKEGNPHLLCINNEFRVNDLWGTVKYGRLTLWCYTAEEQQQSKEAKQVIALYDFQGRQSCDLSFIQGNILSNVIEVDDQWFQGELHGKTGIFPRNYVKDLELPSPSPMNSQPTANSAGAAARSSSRVQSRQSQNLHTEETSFGALMKELKTAAERRSVYLDD